MPEDPRIEELEDDDGSPTAEVPSRDPSDDKEAETVETPTMESKPTEKPRRRMSKSDRAKLWIILVSPIVFIVLIAGLFVIKIDGVSIWDRFMSGAFGDGVQKADAKDMQIPRYIQAVQQAESEVTFYTEKLDQIEKEAAKFKPGDRPNILPLQEKCRKWTEALGGLANSMNTMAKKVTEYESVGKTVRPSSAEMNEAARKMQPVVDRAAKLAIELDRKAWKVGEKPPPPSDDNIIESGDHKKKKDK